MYTYICTFSQILYIRHTYIYMYIYIVYTLIFVYKRLYIHPHLYIGSFSQNVDRQHHEIAVGYFGT